MSHDARRPIPLRRLRASGAWLWLVRPSQTETAPPLSHVLQHGLPGLLVALGTEIARHG
jgi:hypothetical protein